MAVYDDMTWAELLADPSISVSVGFIDLDYYKNVYSGYDPGDDDELTKAIIRASDDINAAAGWQLGSDISELDTIVKNLVYKATAAQTEWYVLNGETYNEDSGAGSVTISKFSYSNGSSSSASGDSMSLCKRAKMYLAQSGLMYRGVGVW